MKSLLPLHFSRGVAWNVVNRIQIEEVPTFEGGSDASRLRLAKARGTPHDARFRGKK